KIKVTDDEAKDEATGEPKELTLPQNQKKRKLTKGGVVAVAFEAVVEDKGKKAVVSVAAVPVAEKVDKSKKAKAKGKVDEEKSAKRVVSPSIQLPPTVLPIKTPA
ncbi:hypothetical protein Dimus_027067, partial [Dionaea muscipula]